MVGTWGRFEAQGPSGIRGLELEMRNTYPYIYIYTLDRIWGL